MAEPDVPPLTQSLSKSISINIKTLKTSCANCHLHLMCLPMGLSDNDISKLDHIIGLRRRIPRGEHLYRMDDPFKNLFAVRFGHFKTYQLSQNGEQQITGFQMSGELLGMDAIGTGKHHCDAVALEDSEVCDIPFSRLQELLGHIPTLLHHFHRIMSQEITREQNAMLLLGNMRAEQRFATFLLNLSSRYTSRGYSSTAFQLRMSREDIGNYLGLTIESISRLVSRFKKEGLAEIDKRDIRLINMEKIKTFAAGEDICKTIEKQRASTI